MSYIQSAPGPASSHSVSSAAYRRSEPSPRPAPRSEAAPARETDSVELSALVRRLASQDPEIRHDLVARVRAEIAAGTYDTPEKLERAADELVRDLDLQA